MCETTNKNSNIFKYNIGFGAKEETLKIHYIKDSEELTSLYENIPQRQFTSSEDVRIRTVDEFLRENKIPKITYLKIDVEGHELKVLEGARETINGFKTDYIQFEFGESMIDARVFFRDFWNLLSENYIIYRILPNGIREIKKYSESLEIFHCINFLAVSKLLK
jgi:FkbM family methyltransferase